MWKAILAVGLTVGVVAGLIVFIGGSGGGNSETDRAGPTPTTTTTTDKPLTAEETAEKTEAEDWNNEVSQAFGGQGLSSDIRDLLSGVEKWKRGELGTEQFNADMVKHLDLFLRARDRMRAVRPYPRDARVKDFYVRSADLYVEALRVYQDMVAFGPGPMRDQTELMAKRIRELGDRIFDRGRAIVDPRLHIPTPENVEVRLPEEVPNWVAEGFAAGPPLDDQPPPADPSPPLRQAIRATEDRSTWVAALTSTSAPSAADVAAAIAAGDPGRLRDQARALVAAAEKLRAEPDPSTPEGREESARVRLGLLVDADAARAAQLAVLAATVDRGAADRLMTTARRLALTGDGLWLPDLPPRQSGFDPALLTQTP